MNPQAAVSLPHHVNRNGVTELEAGTALEALTPQLEALGHEVKIRALTSGLHAIRTSTGGLEGGAAPRREGVALGHEGAVPMKLYDWQGAPNPRRVLMFLKEKDIQIPVSEAGAKDSTKLS